MQCLHASTVAVSRSVLTPSASCSRAPNGPLEKYRCLRRIHNRLTPPVATLTRDNLDVIVRLVGPTQTPTGYLDPVRAMLRTVGYRDLMSIDVPLERSTLPSLARIRDQSRYAALQLFALRVMVNRENRNEEKASLRGGGNFGYL